MFCSVSCDSLIFGLSKNMYKFSDNPTFCSFVIKLIEFKSQLPDQIAKTMQKKKNVGKHLDVNQYTGGDSAAEQVGDTSFESGIIRLHNNMLREMVAAVPGSSCSFLHNHTRLPVPGGVPGNTPCNPGWAKTKWR